jgi:hypothetical protein
MSTPPGWEGLLDEGETILWQGRPDGAVRFTGGLKDSAIGLFFCGFSVLWMTMASRLSDRAPPLFKAFPLFGLPILAMGLHMVAGRFFWDAYRRRNTWYTLTDRRAFIARTNLGRRSLRAWEVAEFESLELVLGPPDTVWFASELPRSSARRGRQRIGFRYLADGRTVYDLMRKVKLQDATPG